MWYTGSMMGMDGREEGQGQKPSLGDSIAESFGGLVRQAGDRMDIDTKICVVWKVEHKNCKGCPSQLGCCKVAAMMLVATLRLSYTPESFEDLLGAMKTTGERIDKIINSKSIEEVRAVV